MAKYRKRPVIIDAEPCEREEVIHTLQGDMLARPGDWIVTGIRGERYPVRADIFAVTFDDYRPVGHIWFHGTTQENAESILREGFRAGSYFTPYLSTAIEQGGNHVLAVFFPEEPSTYWEWISQEPIPTDRILWKRTFSYDQTYHSEECAVAIRRHQHAIDYPGKAFCERCRGLGELGAVPDVPWRERIKIDVCPDCGGYGVLDRWGGIE